MVCSLDDSQQTLEIILVEAHFHRLVVFATQIGVLLESHKHKGAINGPFWGFPLPVMGYVAALTQQFPVVWLHETSVGLV